ncbi:MAG: GTPase Era, partial [Acidimicrobiales bacterium]
KPLQLAIVGRPNVGKSTLLNAIVGIKVSITSPHPNTTRVGVRGVLDSADAQVVFIDTPGLHRPRSPLGSRLNEKALAALSEVDLVLAVLDATQSIGPGDTGVLERAVAAAAQDGCSVFVAVNKIDRARRDQVLARLAEASDLVGSLQPNVWSKTEYFPVSARTKKGLEPLMAAIVGRMPEGHRFYPKGTTSDVQDAIAIAELVREQLLRATKEELPHSIACVVTEWEWPRIRCEILVERESQKGIVIGAGGGVLKAVGTAVRAQLPEGAYLELFVRVERHWQSRRDILDRLGY